MTGGRSFDLELKTIGLFDGYHGVFAFRNDFLSDTEEAGDIARVHARVVGGLNLAFVAVTVVEVATAVAAWNNLT